MAESTAVHVQVGDRQLRVTNLDKVLYPMAGFTKADVLRYYVEVAPTMLAHLGHRCVTLVRFPNGVGEQSFFEKRCPSHRPDWIETALGPGGRGEGIRYCEFNSVAAVVWAANLAALELHTPMSRSHDMDAALIAVFDLDPGERAGMTECCRVAVEIHDVLELLGLQSFAKTSGSKGLQVYVPLNASHTFEHTSQFALAIAKLVKQQLPELVVTEMAKAVRVGKVFIDWSQNSRHKTTVCAYSLRAKDYPEVSTPLIWEEVHAGAEGLPLGFDPEDVLGRISAHGDLFAPVAELVQHLPSAPSDTEPSETGPR